ncbi:MAG: M48 family metalloprotease, partial [Armatimonadetes bacterium]|nr:M48 family metalloprotease [Candidatus Hippobium faecium]
YMSKKRYILIILLLLLFLPCFVYAGFSVEQEREMGAEANKDVVKIFIPTKTPEKQKELEDFGKKLTEACERHDYEYEFHLGLFSGKNADGYNFNAFAIPGGYVYFGEKLWDIMNENEREGIIAHEIVHVDRKHSLKQAEKNQLTNLGIVAIMAVFKVKSNSIAALGANLLSMVLSNNYSISDEKEADIKGTELLMKAGLDPCGVLGSMRKLYRMDGKKNDSIPAFLMDHPKTKERIKYLKNFLEKKGIEITEENIEYKYPENMLGRISEVNYSKDKYKVLNFKLSEGKTVNAGDKVCIQYFVWDDKYENLIPAVYGYAIVKKISGNEAKLDYSEDATENKGQITEDFIVTVSEK